MASNEASYNPSCWGQRLDRGCGRNCIPTSALVLLSAFVTGKIWG